MTRTIVIKVGTHVVTQRGRISQKALTRLCTDIGHLRDQGIAVVLVSSGAVAAGMGAVGEDDSADEIERRQVCSAVGQIRLMQTYARQFARQGRECAQVLATRSDFRDRQHYLNMQRCLKALLARGVVPVVNENDVVSVTELMFTDNDELAGLLALMLGADGLFLLTNVAGIFADQERRNLISEWHDDQPPVPATTSTKSEFGRGGIHTKLRVARRTAGLGVETWIADGRESGIVNDLLAGTGTGTRFPAKRAASPVKRWVATSGGQEKGQVTVNPGAERALRDPTRLTSLLPVGVTAIAGGFEKGDILRIVSETGHLVGFGRARYGSESARQHVGQRGARALVHYDYLYIESPL